MAEFKHVNAMAFVRLARREEVSQLLNLFRNQAEFHGLAEEFAVTKAKLEACLFTQPAFQGPTVLLFELSPPSYPLQSTENSSPKPEKPHQQPYALPTPAEKSDQEDPFGETTSAEKSEAYPSPKTSFAEDPSTSFAASLRNRCGIAHNIVLRAPVLDPHAQAFQSAEGRIIAGFVLFFPKYISFLGKNGFYIEDVHVRECFWGHGFGTILLKSVARLAAELDYGRVEGCVMDWNEKAMKLYKTMGANILMEWKLFSLSGENLKMYSRL